jgi:FAD:protein FMN transferase
MRRVKAIMGMSVSIDIPEVDSDSIFDQIFDRLRAIDRQFSSFRADSEVSRYSRGELDDDIQLSLSLQQIKTACAAYERLTSGYFSAYFNGKFNPTGYVKGWAIQQVADILTKQGYGTYLINAAGDVLAASNGDRRWQIGLQHPTQRLQTIGAVSLKNGAVATSGTYERGRHIFNPHTKTAVDGIISATVCGLEIITADVLATTCVAMGLPLALGFMEAQFGYEALLIGLDGSVLMTSQFATN